jgi:hypothetical protein
MRTGRYEHTATLLRHGAVIVTGGGNGPTKSAEAYDYTRGVWKNAGSTTIGRAGHTATRLRDGRLLLAGGYDGTDDDHNYKSAELGTSEP